jgi:Lysyl oxidase
MPPNIVPIVRDISIGSGVFSPSSCEVQEGCAQAGQRKLLKFSTVLHNAGDSNLEIGDPSSRPHLFEYSPCHNHYHLKEFTSYRLIRNSDGSTILGRKQAFCLMDIERIDSNAPKSARYTCSYQGIQRGWGDVYHSGLDCQWVDITGISDGDYILEVRVNTGRLLPESYYGDNSTWKGVRITGNTMTEIPAIIPEDCIGFNPSDTKVENINGRWLITAGRMSLLNFEQNEANARKALRIIQQYGFTNQCFVGRPAGRTQKPMQYYLVRRQAPTGAFQGEDCIPIDLATLRVEKIDNRWKVVDRISMKFDFGASRDNAQRALDIIKMYGFTNSCFVGRPNAPMNYFRRT